MLLIVMSNLDTTITWRGVANIKAGTLKNNNQTGMNNLHLYCSHRIKIKLLQV